MGEVFLAATGEIEGAERPCVVKIIRREHAEDKSFLARFLDEARIQAQLHHPGVAQILEAAIGPDGKPFVVVEYVEGRNLGELRARAAQLGARIGWADAVAVGLALGEALAHVHERTDAAGRPLEIVHRDLSPQNIMLGYDGDIKLIDFGTARAENRRCHTVSGIVFAKPGYVAPEVANNNPGGVPADIYAFGIMLWEILAGRRFLTGSPSDHLAEVAAGRRNPPPIAAQAAAPPELDSIIARMTASRIEDRFGSARDAMTDLAQVLKGAPSLADGERSVRSRVARLVRRLYPAEPARSRAEFARLVAAARALPAVADAAPVTPTPSPTSKSTPPLLPGTRYRLVREIGRGGMGVVYEAFHVDLSRAVALKVLPKERVSSPSFAESFRAEARAIARLGHNNLVALHDFGLSADGQPYYAMELLDGESLEQYLGRERGMDWREAVALAMQACDALEVAHDAGITHRDIKPANLFLTRSGTLKILDFGLAAIDEPADVVEADSTASSALAVVGTPEYMAPEQAKRERVDARSDLYSLGTVLYELVTGGLPYSALGTIALIDAKTRLDPEPPRRRAPKRGLPTMLDQTIQRAIARDPDARFQSADEMRDALARTLQEPFRLRRRRRLIGFAALGALVLGAAGFSVVVATNADLRARVLTMAEPVVQQAQTWRAQYLKSSNAAPEGSEVAALSAAAAPAEPADPAQEAVPNEAADGDDEPDSNPEAVADDESSAPALAEAGELEADGPEATPSGTDVDAAPAEAKTFAAQPVAEASASDELEAQIQEAWDLMDKGSRVKAFGQLRKLGQKHRKDPRALRAWSEAAVRMHGWGEAYRVAVQWAAVDQSAEARMHLARMQRAVGKRDAAVQTLTLLLQDHPRCGEARELLRTLNGAARVAMQ